MRHTEAKQWFRKYMISQTGGGEKIFGTIDETDIFSNALTAAQVQNLYLGQRQTASRSPVTAPLTIINGSSLDLNEAKIARGTLTAGGSNNNSRATTVNGGVRQIVNMGGPGTAPGMIAQYHLDGTLGSIASGAKIIDSVGGHNGTVNGNGATYVAGKYGQAINFDGASNIQIPYSSSFNLSTYSFSAWVYFTAQPASTPGCGIFGTRQGDDFTFDIKYYNYAGTLMLHGDIGDGRKWLTVTADAPVTLSLNTWHMVTYVVNGSSSYSIYVDGSPLVSNASYTAAGTPQFMQPGSTMLIGDTNGNDKTTIHWYFGVQMQLLCSEAAHLLGIGEEPAHAKPHTEKPNHQDPSPKVQDLKSKI